MKFPQKKDGKKMCGFTNVKSHIFLPSMPASQILPFIKVDCFVLGRTFAVNYKFRIR